MAADMISMDLAFWQVICIVMSASIAGGLLAAIGMLALRLWLGG